MKKSAVVMLVMVAMCFLLQSCAVGGKGADMPTWTAPSTTKVLKIPESTTVHSTAPSGEVTTVYVRYTVSTTVSEQLGQDGITLSPNDAAKVYNLIGSLTLSPIAKPSADSFPVGGAITLSIKPDNSSEDKYSFYSKNLIEYDGVYFSDSSENYDKLIEVLTSIIES